MNRWDAGVRATRRIPPDDALGTALWLVGKGLWPVPITPPDDPSSPNPGKAPIGRGWGAHRLLTRALFAIFHRHPRAGVGLVLGPAAGVVDLEIDDRQLRERAPDIEQPRPPRNSTALPTMWSRSATTSS